MKEDFSVPKEFEKYSDDLFKQHAITKREFVDFCLLAIKLIDDHWNMRQGIAYRIAGTLTHDNIRKDKILGQIAGEFGSLELPDYHVAYPRGTEEENEVAVRKRWDDIKLLIQEADQKF
jgi:hypothetical protein